MRTPVILDTDIGDDIDDAWALVMLLNSPELDIKLVTTTSRYPDVRARYLGRLLEIAGRTDVPIAIGPVTPDQKENAEPTVKYPWVKDYDLSAYPGTVFADAAPAIHDVIMTSDEKVSVVAIGPLSTLGETLRRFPQITGNSRFIGMHGSIYRGYNGADEPCSETNVRLFNQDCREVFSSDWDITISPLDTCGTVVLRGDDYQKIRQSQDPLVLALVELNELFAEHVPWMTYDCKSASSVLFDTVAIYLAISEAWVEMETLPIVIADGGYTKIDAAGKPVRCAINWKDQQAFQRYLVQRILNEN